MSRKISFTVISIAGVIGVSAFVLSFFALNDLAVRFGIPPRISFLWPIIVDGLIIAGTVSLLALASWDRRDRVYPWAVFALGAGVSVVANGYHSYIVVGGSGLSTLAGVMVGAMPPLALLVITHLGVHMIKRQSTQAVSLIKDGRSEPLHPPSGGGAPIIEDTISDEVDLDAVEPKIENVEKTLPLDPPLIEPQSDPVLPERTPVPVGKTFSPSDREFAAWVAEREAAGKSVTGAMAAEFLGVSASTGRRRLAKLRESASNSSRHLRQVVNQ